MWDYLVVSADGHAGPPRRTASTWTRVPAFDAHQGGVEAGRMVNTAFVEEWDEETAATRMRAGYDPAVRGAVLDRRAWRPRCCSPDADVLGTGRWPARRSARASARAPASIRGRGQGRGPGPQPLAGRLLRHQPPPRHRRGGRPDHGQRRRRGGRGGRPPPGACKGVLIPTRWFDRPRLPRPPLRPGVGGVRRGRAWSCTPTPAPAGRLPARSGFCRSTPPRPGGGRRPPSGCSCCRACSSATPTSSTRSPRTVPGGCPTS